MCHQLVLQLQVVLSATVVPVYLQTAAVLGLGHQRLGRRQGHARGAFVALAPPQAVLRSAWKSFRWGCHPVPPLAVGEQYGDQIRHAVCRRVLVQPVLPAGANWYGRHGAHREPPRRGLDHRD